MKKYLILTGILALAGIGLAGGFGDGWSPASYSGTGPFSADTLNTKKIVLTTTTGDSVLIYTGADSPKIVFSVNGGRDSIYWVGATGSWFTLPKVVTVKGADEAQVQIVGAGNSTIFMQSSSAGTFTSITSINYNQTAYLPLKLAAASFQFGASNAPFAKIDTVGADSVYIHFPNGSKAQIPMIIIPAP